MIFVKVVEFYFRSDLLKVVRKSLNCVIMDTSGGDKDGLGNAGSSSVPVFNQPTTSNDFTIPHSAAGISWKTEETSPLHSQATIVDDSAIAQLCSETASSLARLSLTREVPVPSEWQKRKETGAIRRARSKKAGRNEPYGRRTEPMSGLEQKSTARSKAAPGSNSLAPYQLRNFNFVGNKNGLTKQRSPSLPTIPEE